MSNQQRSARKRIASPYQRESVSSNSGQQQDEHPAESNGQQARGNSQKPIQKFANISENCWTDLINIWWKVPWHRPWLFLLQHWSPAEDQPENENDQEDMDEYALKRLRNNAAVSRTRQKKRMEQAKQTQQIIPNFVLIRHSLRNGWRSWGKRTPNLRGSWGFWALIFQVISRKFVITQLMRVLKNSRHELG